MLLTVEEIVYLAVVLMGISGFLRVILGSLRAEKYKYSEYGTADVFVGMCILILALTLILG